MPAKSASKSHSSADKDDKAAAAAAAAAAAPSAKLVGTAVCVGVACLLIGYGLFLRTSPELQCRPVCRDAPVWHQACDQDGTHVTDHADYFSQLYCDAELRWSTVGCATEPTTVAPTTPPTPTTPSTTTTSTARPSTTTPPRTTRLPTGNTCYTNSIDLASEDAFPTTAATTVATSPTTSQYTNTTNSTSGSTQGAPTTTPQPRPTKKCSSVTAFCYVFAPIASGDTKPIVKATAQFGCYESDDLQAVDDTIGCGKSMGDGECKPTMVRRGNGWLPGTLCCCDGNECNAGESLYDAAKKQARADGFQCGTDKAPHPVAPTDCPATPPTAVDRPCSDTAGAQGSLCFDIAYNKQGLYRRRGCHSQFADAHGECVLHLGAKQKTCITLLDGETAVCCCHGTSSCTPDDAVTFQLYGDPHACSPVKPQAQASLLGAKQAAGLDCHGGGGGGRCSMCYERLPRFLSEEKELRGYALIDLLEQGCASDVLPKGLLKDSDVQQQQPCYLVRGEAVCFCTTGKCNDGYEVWAFVCDADAAKSAGRSQLLGVGLALLGLFILTFLIVRLDGHN